MRTAVLLVVLATAAHAQPVVPENVPCTYDTCAIRIEGHLFGGPSVVRGPVGTEERLGRAGILLNGLEVAVSDVPIAADHARTASRYRVASLATGLVAGVAVAATVGDIFYRDVFDAEFGLNTAETVVYAGGIVMLLVSTGLELKSQNEQSRAVWEYNRATVGR